MNVNKIQVIIISQQFMLRQGIEHSLTGVEDIIISGAAEVNESVLATIDTTPPDVVLLDVDGGAQSSLVLARKIKTRLPSIGIVALTSKPDDAELFQVLKAQAVAYLSKEVSPDELVDTIRHVAHGEHPINESLITRPKVAEQVLVQFQELSLQSEAEDFLAPLTPRETEILNCMAQGYLNKQIAIELNISEQTIKNHITSILRKLNANARTEAVVVAIRQGLITVKAKSIQMPLPITKTKENLLPK
ncbi:MAG: response regulator transcription factor [Dehalococcoidales bacterium]|nr:response regulator transcription factor [Dehalococcoidales bacterium]